MGRTFFKMMMDSDPSPPIATGNPDTDNAAYADWAKEQGAREASREAREREEKRQAAEERALDEAQKIIARVNAGKKVPPHIELEARRLVAQVLGGRQRAAEKASKPNYWNPAKALLSVGALIVVFAYIRGTSEQQAPGAQADDAPPQPAAVRRDDSAPSHSSNNEDATRIHRRYGEFYHNGNVAFINRDEDYSYCAKAYDLTRVYPLESEGSYCNAVSKDRNLINHAKTRTGSQVDYKDLETCAELFISDAVTDKHPLYKSIVHYCREMCSHADDDTVCKDIHY